MNNSCHRISVMKQHIASGKGDKGEERKISIKCQNCLQLHVCSFYSRICSPKEFEIKIQQLSFLKLISTKSDLLGQKRRFFVFYEYAAAINLASIVLLDTTRCI